MSSNPREEAQRWLLHAEADLGFARLGTEMGFYHAQTCLMVHHAAEKALKALLYLRGTRLVREDSILDLVKRVADVHPSLNRYQDMAAGLDRYYPTARYLGVLPGQGQETIGEGQAKEAVAEGENLILEVRNIIRLAR